ncbi:hypothetical protein [Niallia sp. MER TA 168]|nr:hypothetical protein [Niallia sp. MER TA 168]
MKTTSEVWERNFAKKKKEAWQKHFYIINFYLYSSNILEIKCA